jgi:hypothetical protein
MTTFVSRSGITATFERVDSNPFMSDPSWNARHYKCVLRLGTRRMTVPFSCGMALPEPTAVDVIQCLISDMSTLENTNGFDDWCFEFGFDPDSRKEMKRYQACVRQSDRFKAFLGDLLENAMNTEEV